jgi:hypothetical protein
MATLTSHLGLFINELRGYNSVDNRDTNGYLSVPDGRVVVSSILDDGARAISTLQFGGNPSLPQVTRTSLLEVSDEVSRLTTAGGRFKLGGLVNEQRSSVGFVRTGLERSHSTLWPTSKRERRLSSRARCSRRISNRRRTTSAAISAIRGA